MVSAGFVTIRNVVTRHRPLTGTLSSCAVPIDEKIWKEGNYEERINQCKLRNQTSDAVPWPDTAAGGRNRLNQPPVFRKTTIIGIPAKNMSGLPDTERCPLR